MLKNNFKNDLERGKVGEEIVKSFLGDLDWVTDLNDVRDDKEYQKQDIDFVVKTSYSIEVKTDSLAHITGNLAYEYISNKNYNSVGCFEKTKSDYIYYYLTESKELYIIDTIMLQQYVSENKNKLKLVPMGDYALGYLIKFDTLVKEQISEKFNL